MFTRLIVVGFVTVALMAGVGVVMAGSSDKAKACPEDGNPSEGLEKSTIASEWKSLNAAKGVNQAYGSVGCEASLPD